MKRRPARVERRLRKDELGTRRQLLEAAGQVFAERGFDRATGKEICQKAGANIAAVNYYFGGMTGLYAAVLHEAHNRLVTPDALSAAVAGKSDAKAKLRAALQLFVRAITGTRVDVWVLRVLGREIVAPSPALKGYEIKVRKPKVLIMKGIVGELLGLPEDHPAVARCCISVMAPCIMLLIGDRKTLKGIFPALAIGPDDADSLAEHLTQFALAGLDVVSKSIKRQRVV